jgi:hypothetical protein
VLKAYLPAEVTDEEIAAAVAEAKAETGASSPKDMGKLMKAAMAALAASGKSVDGKRVNEAVKKALVRERSSGASGSGSSSGSRG